MASLTAFRDVSALGEWSLRGIVRSLWIITPVRYTHSHHLSTLIEETGCFPKLGMDMTTELRNQALLLLRQALNNPTADFRNGQWEAVCLGRPLMPETYSLERVTQAIQYLRRTDQIIEPRKQWPSQALPIYGFSGNIRDNLRASEGRALSLWGDAGWGELVTKGKYRDNHFDDVLVQGAFEMIQRWEP